MSQNPVYEEIRDDQNEECSQKKSCQDKHEKKQHLSTQHKLQQYEQKYQQRSNGQTTYEHNPNHLCDSQKPSQLIDHQELGKYSNYQQQKQNGQNISIQITKTEKKGGLMSHYNVYVIDGQDNKGSFSMARRFNQFFQMRLAMVARWPGCFVPSIPAKNMINKNDNNITRRRMRYLNDFVKKMAKLPHLYYGEEFQTLLRASQLDISEVFTKWPVLSSQSIINKYRIHFSELAGKELNFDTNEKINQFAQFIKKNQAKLSKDRLIMKQLAESKDQLIESYGSFFSNVFPTYQKECFSQYCNNKQGDLLYMNESQIKLQEHQTIIKGAFIANPFWIFYDMVQHEQRDGLAFIEALQAKNKYQQRKHSLQIKIAQDQRTLAQLVIIKKGTSTNSKGMSQQMKYKLQLHVQQLKRQKQNILIIIDIISAMVSYIQIDRYKREKQSFYLRALTKIGSNQINEVQNLAQIWNGLKLSTSNKLNQFVV